MPVLKRLVFLLLMSSLLLGCKSKKKPSLSGDEPVEVADFIDFFKPLTLPYQYADTSLLKKEKDSLLISYKNFTRFIPDTVLSKLYGKGTKPKIYALGRTEVPKAGTYLFVKTVNGEKRLLFILSMDRQQQFAAAMTGLQPDNNKATVQSVLMDKKYAIIKTVAIKNADGSFSEGKDVYALGADGKSFGLVMTDPLSDKVTELINPIDTLPRKNKFAADYTTGKMNMVSIRDGRRNDHLSFFIHFEKNNGECTGELKGEALIKTPTTAEYRHEGDPCVLKFIFSASAVTLQEVEGCGSRRGLNCSFNGSFARKKYTKPKK